MKESITWQKVLENNMPLNVMLNTLPTKGNLVYEYNPFRNYRLTKDKYWYDGKYYTLEELKDTYNITPDGENKFWNNVPNDMTDPILYEQGQLVDFITDEFKFSLEHPVHIVPQYSYDGSVNLIINDGLNKPRLINSRFSATGRNTYEIVDRKGSNDTNIYDQGEQFDIDTSLYKIVDKIPKIEFLGTSMGGNLKIGNYHFYFRLADSDGNETDFIGESGLVSVFIGEGSYSSVHTGNKNENSAKQVEFSISNIDSAYDYIKIYYSRSTSENNTNSITEYKKIVKKFPKTNSKTIITGFEETEDVTVSDINTHFNIVDAVQTSTVCQNMLFMGNVKNPEIPYQELQDLSLRILPFLGTDEYDPELNNEYSSGNPEESYINPNFIYNKTGYWPDELYRFGIVYILPNGQLTPVFNIRGAIGIGTINKGFTHIPITEKVNGKDERVFVQYNDKTFYLNDPHNTFNQVSYTEDKILGTSDCYNYENAKGVCSFAFNIPEQSDHDNRNPEIYYVRFHIPAELKTYLKKHVKGYFFVRQTRIPLILAQGITVGIDNESGTPTIPTRGGILERLEDTLEKSHVETEDIRSINYISEGFLKRYTFTFKKKSSSLWGKIGKIMGVAALVVGTVAATVVTMGGAAVVAGVAGAVVGSVGIASTSVVVGTALGTAVLSTAVVTGAAAVVAGAATAVLASAQELGQAASRIGAKKRLNGKATVAPDGYKIVETEDSRTLVEDFEERIIIKDSTKNKVNAIICPDYTVNQAYYNQIFTGNEHYITTDYRQSSVIDAESGECFFTNNHRHFYIDTYGHYKSNINKIFAKIIGVPDNVACIGIDGQLFRSRAGEAEEAWRYKCVGEEVTTISNSEQQKINSDIIRGSFGPYLAFNNNSIGPARIVNIYIPGYDFANMKEYIDIRMTDSSTYYAITDRYDINDFESRLLGDLKDEDSWTHAYRGDCYICQFTQRINRNFNDPSAPYNTDIVDKNTWRDNYDPDDPEKYAQINLGDVNAIPLGMWATFQLRSSNNLNIRTMDDSDVDETAMTGQPRGYYPVQPMSTEGVYKKQESQVYNKGFAKSVSDKWNFELPDVPYIKNWFGTRIMYSDVHINDGYKNGFRIFRGTNYRDYTREYGSITKLISFESSLLCVFEHGIALIPVNERAVAGQGAGGNVYINTSNVLPENPKIISDMFGSQWPESILKVPGRTGNAPQYVYGVDTVAKKIWRTDGNTLECISDFKVQEFLNNNITLGERELTPKIGIRNVKTLYNAFKRDVMFTFYDNTYGFEEKVWNLCWNELLQKFITFYSWVPSYMENINNIPFSFNRDTSKWIAKLGVSHTENSFADGITLSNVITNNRVGGQTVNDFNYQFTYTTKDGSQKTVTREVPTDKRDAFVGVLSLSNRVLPSSQIFYNISYSLERDSFKNYKKFKIQKVADISLSSYTDAMFQDQSVPIYGLYFAVENNPKIKVYYMNAQGGFNEVKDGAGKNIFIHENVNNVESLLSELYYRNREGHVYADDEINKISWKQASAIKIEGPATQDQLVKLTMSKFNEIVNMQEGPDKDKAMATKIYLGGPVNYYSCGDIKQLYEKPGRHVPVEDHWIPNFESGKVQELSSAFLEYPIFKDLTGKRPMLKEDDMLNEDKIVTLLNIKATINILDQSNTNKLGTDYFNMKAGYAAGTSLVNAGQYESTVAITPKWNLQFLSTDFWKHGQAGIIDIADDIKPTYWYGKRHPFEFEVVVVNDPSTHKIFSNLELIANKAKPESFHYEIIGESYDFAKDKVNMYFRQEALKALWQYNGVDITYDRNFLKVQPVQQVKSADFPHRYYARQDKINNIEDSYVTATYPKGYDYRHLSGAEIIYYPNRQEYRIWNHAPAVSLDDLSQDDSRSIIAANCKYLEDRWKITINPILVCYKNEYTDKYSGALIQPANSTWGESVGGGKLPAFAILNSPLPDRIIAQGSIEFPDPTEGIGRESALYNLYKDPVSAIDNTSWLSDPNIYKTSFGESQNRKELDLKDKFIKIRIRYTGEELAVIDFLNTIYRVSYA